MKYVDEFRDRGHAETLAHAIKSMVTRPWTIMEVCGGQTHSIVKFGLDELLPDFVTLVHGPGCPVCVTPVTLIDHALTLASIPRVILCTFGVLLPGHACAVARTRASRAAGARLSQTCAEVS